MGVEGIMAYFLKKSKLKKGTYLQIYESFYDPQRKQTAHHSYKALGYVDELIDKGITNPVAYYQNEVDILNQKRKNEKEAGRVRQISAETPEKNLGYFLLKGINDSLGASGYLDLLQMQYGFKFAVSEMLSSLIYARAVQPCSKSKTYDEVLPTLYEQTGFSKDQLYTGMDFFGREYEKIIEIYNAQISQIWPSDTSHTYFDCTNFYFEIDREDAFRRRGPSKESRHDPIVGMGLLLDANQIPIGMKMYPGNESEKPVIREVIDGLKKRNAITGRTIQVADKGLNCADNIVHALQAGDGYIFSKSVKMLPEIEKTWVLLDNDYQDVLDDNNKLKFRIKSCVDDFPYTITDSSGKKKTVLLREKRVVSYNPQLAEKKKYEINKQIEKARILSASKAKKDEFGDSAKYVRFLAKDKDAGLDRKVTTELNHEAIEEDLRLAGYNLIVTSEVKMSSRQIYDAYHNLWRIEESFRIMKSQLDARPVYMRTRETITGHFLVCYLTVLLARLLQFKALDNKYSSEELLSLIRDFRAVKVSDRRSVNITRNGPTIQRIATETSLPLTSYFLSEGDIKRIMKYRFEIKKRK